MDSFIVPQRPPFVTILLTGMVK